MRQAVSRLSLFLAQALRTGRPDIPVDWAAQNAKLSDFRCQVKITPLSIADSTFLLFKVKAESHHAKSTAKIVNREKSLKTRGLNPKREQFSGGPGVPDSRQMRVFHEE